MKNKKVFYLILFIILLIIISVIFYINLEEGTETKTEITKGMMILIEYEDPEKGLVNFINELQKRNIPSALLATPEYVQNNCETIKKMTEYDMEIIGSNTGAPFWDMSYEKQYERISEIKEGIESCTGEPLKIVGSRFFASDENTVKVAEELGIPYVTARGTTGTKGTVYNPEDYDVKILSVSNIERVEFKYGSLCDYSYWTRGGEPEDMKKDLVDAVNRYNRVTPVSHTNIGGYLKAWMGMWKNFWDNSDIKWVSLNKFMSEADYEMPFYKIPQNRNAPYTPEMLEHVEGESEGTERKNTIENPCSAEELPEVNNENSSEQETELIMFHNNTGPMCLKAKEFFKEEEIEYKEILTTNDNFGNKLKEYKQDFSKSEGVSESFGYYPIIFVGDKAFSGFNEDIKKEIIENQGI